MFPLPHRALEVVAGFLLVVGAWLSLANRPSIGPRAALHPTSSRATFCFRSWYILVPPGWTVYNNRCASNRKLQLNSVSSGTHHQPLERREPSAWIEKSPSLPYSVSSRTFHKYGSDCRVNAIGSDKVGCTTKVISWTVASARTIYLQAMNSKWYPMLNLHYILYYFMFNFKDTLLCEGLCVDLYL